jgi:hypothetical protein
MPRYETMSFNWLIKSTPVAYSACREGGMADEDTAAAASVRVGRVGSPQLALVSHARQLMRPFTCFSHRHSLTCKHAD